MSRKSFAIALCVLMILSALPITASANWKCIWTTDWTRHEVGPWMYKDGKVCREVTYHKYDRFDRDHICETKTEPECCYKPCDETTGVWVTTGYGPWHMHGKKDVCRDVYQVMYDKYIPGKVCKEQTIQDCKYSECSETQAKYGPWSDWKYKDGKLCRERKVTFYDKFTGNKCGKDVEKECKGYKECSDTKTVIGPWGPEYYPGGMVGCRDRVVKVFDVNTGKLCSETVETSCRTLTKDESGNNEVTFKATIPVGVVFEGTNPHAPDEKVNYYRGDFGATTVIQLTAQRTIKVGNGITKGNLQIVDTAIGPDHPIFTANYEVRFEAYESDRFQEPSGLYVFSRQESQNRIELPIDWTLPAGPKALKLMLWHNTYFGNIRVWSNQILYVPGRHAWEAEQEPAQ